MDPQQIGETPGGDAVRIAQCGIGVDLLLIAVNHPPVIGIAHADEDTGAAAEQGRGCNCRILQSFPGNFQQEALLRVHGNGLARRYEKEFCVESIDVPEERAAADIHLSWFIGIGVVVGVDVPAFFGNFGYGINAFREHPPERSFIVRAARQA